ncbi:hypothetical protein [Salibaculum sp.]|uniref:hypothetical protein n=1 Tax=Salibaculum sp. TaxID=2855480 RepID=UPI002B46FD35|nr:hypothetical protein [Salibaculum sp.]HKL69197.1 hypothetical protein [Salibaculum sp.]
MGKPHPTELRTRFVDFIEEGNTHRATAAHFRVSVKFVNDMVKLKRETGALAQAENDDNQPQGLSL